MSLMHIPDSAGITIKLMKYGDQGYISSPSFPPDTLENLHKTEIRDDDIMLCSYPKSGCHWLWEITRMLQAGTTELPVVEKDMYMIDEIVRSKLRELPSPRILNSHVLFRQLPKKVQDGRIKLIFIYRNPKDVAVSYYNHHTKIPSYEYKGQFKDYLTGLFLNKCLDYGDIFAYMRDWEAVFDNKPNIQVFVVSYEELQADTFSKAKELAQFLGSTPKDDTIREIVDKCSFNKMRERKAQEWLDKHGEIVMYRKGQVGDWKNWFTVAQSEMMDAICEKEMEGSSFKFQYTL